MLKVLMVVVCVGGCFAGELGPGWQPSCTSGTLDQVLDKLVARENIEVSSGVKFVKVNETPESDGGRSVKDSVLSRVKRFFANYELQVKLSDIFQRKQDMIDTLRKALISLTELQGDSSDKMWINHTGHDGTPRGKGGSGFGGGKKGGGAILVIATMMGGMMAALGYGALGMLVMKALTVSSMALLLSAVIGLRRLFRRPDDDAGFGRISYIPVHTEHRKRRSFQDLAYRVHARSK